MISHLYMILCANGHCYFGSSKEVNKRLQKHKYSLRNNKHENSRLQSCWNKYGEDSFIFKILKEVPREEQYAKEQVLLDLYYDKPWCMNLNPSAGGPPQFTPEVLEKLTGENNHFYGKQHTDESILKMPQSKQVKVAYEDGKTEVYRSIKKTAETFGISREALRDYLSRYKDKKGWYKQKNIPTKMRKAGIVEVTRA